MFDVKSGVPFTYLTSSSSSRECGYVDVELKGVDKLLVYYVDKIVDNLLITLKCG